jgi:hypothetical protein
MMAVRFKMSDGKFEPEKPVALFDGVDPRRELVATTSHLTDVFSCLKRKPNRLRSACEKFFPQVSGSSSVGTLNFSELSGRNPPINVL